MLFTGSLYLLLCCILPANNQKIGDTSITQDDQSFPLDMAENSVDDMYSTCATEMEGKVKGCYFKEEIKNKLFEKAWKNAEKCAIKNIKEKVDEALTKDHRKAICVYTAGGPADFYREFNEAVRTKRKHYGSSFPFHSLHFWLTRAIQILNSKNECYTTFRRTKSEFTGKVNQEIRFGTFASSSKLLNLTHFGKITCFKITTCYGAYLKEYSKLGDKEKEVLIPPYEKFKIISRGTRELGDCEIAYVLKSTGFQSKLDCKVAK